MEKKMTIREIASKAEQILNEQFQGKRAEYGDIYLAAKKLNDFFGEDNLSFELGMQFTKENNLPHQLNRMLRLNIIGDKDRRFNKAIYKKVEKIEFTRDAENSYIDLDMTIEQAFAAAHIKSVELDIEKQLHQIAHHTAMVEYIRKDKVASERHLAELKAKFK